MTVVVISTHLAKDVFHFEGFIMTPIEKICCPRHGGSGDKTTCPFCK